MSVKNFLIINSNERINSYETPEIGDSIFELPHFFIGPKQLKGDQYCKLVKFQIANTFYNVTNANNILIINGSNVVIPEGNYTFTELFNYMTNNIAQIANVQYNDITCKLTIDLLNPADTLAFPSYGSANNLLGFEQSYNAVGISHVSARPPSVVDLEIFIEIEGMSSQYISSNTKMRFMPTFVIPNNTNKNSFNSYYEKTHYSQISKVMNLPRQFRIRLKNQYNEILKCCSDYTLIISFIEVCC